MIFVKSDNRDAAYYFSIEQYLTRNKKFDEPVFMLWHVDTCIMVGNNQVIEAEVNLNFAKELNIPITRRQSGGGTIFVDDGTVLCTLISPLDGEVKAHMEQFAVVLINALQKMGANAYREGKNDILLDGKKIVGMAQFSAGGHVCTHASLLYDTDLDTLTKILIPHDEKLIPKGIRSIRSRVTNIKDGMETPPTSEQFRAKLEKEVLNTADHRLYKFTSDETSEIERIYEDYKEKYKYYER